MLRGASVLLENSRGCIALQLRDDRPGVGHRDHWGIFSGMVEEGETPDEAAVREIGEELNVLLDGNKLTFLRSFVDARGLEAFLFHYPVRNELDDAVLGEGQKFAFLTAEEIGNGEIEGKNVVPFHLSMLQWYFTTGKD